MKILFKLFRLVLSLFLLYLAGRIVYFWLSMTGSVWEKLFWLVPILVLAYIFGGEAWGWIWNGMKDE